MDKIKLAVLGLNQGSKIARDAKANPEIELVAVAGFGDHDVKVAEELGVPLYNDYTLLLKQEDLDAVAIALPNTLHVQSTELALAAGIKNILLEKPIANTVEEAEHIIKICEDAGATLLVGHHRRSSNRYQLLRQVIDSGKLGKIVGIQSNYAIAKPHEYFDVEWHTKKGSGPLLINAIHDFDDLNFVTGMKPTKVYAAARNTIRGNEVEDSVSAVVEYEGGVTASYFVSMALLVLGTMTWQPRRTLSSPCALAKTACAYSAPRVRSASRTWICTIRTTTPTVGYSPSSTSTSTLRRTIR